MMKRMLRKTLIMVLLTVLLLVMLPTPSYADGDSIWFLLGLAFIVVLVINADDNLFKNMYYDVYGLDAEALMLNSSDGTMLLGQDLYYDIDWLFAEREEGQLWAGTGITMRFSPSYSNYYTDRAFGGNVLLGYNNDDWDWLARYIILEDGESVAKVEATFKF